MANVRVILAQRNARLDALNVAINADAGPGTVKFYTVTQPTNADTAIGAQVHLGTVTFPDPAAPSAATGGVLTFGTFVQGLVLAPGGTATWARVADQNGDTVFDCDVTAVGGGGTIQLNTNVLVTGGPIQITAFTLTDPA